VKNDGQIDGDSRGFEFSIKLETSDFRERENLYHLSTRLSINQKYPYQ